MSARTLSPLFSWRGAIADSELRPTTRHVALTLSLHMSERGDSCFPGLATQVAETGLSKATVCRALAELEASGYLTRHPGGRGPKDCTRYEATVPQVSQPDTLKCLNQTPLSVSPRDTRTSLESDIEDATTATAAANGNKPQKPRTQKPTPTRPRATPRPSHDEIAALLAERGRSAEAIARALDVLATATDVTQPGTYADTVARHIDETRAREAARRAPPPRAAPARCEHGRALADRDCPACKRAREAAMAVIRRPDPPPPRRNGHRERVGAGP